jgi:hypothetical protein
VRSHAVAVPSHPAGDLGGGGCGSTAAAHGSQASRRDRGRGGAEYEEDPCACEGGRGHRGVSTAVEKAEAR